MVQDEGPGKGRPRGLFEAPGLWRDAYPSGRTSSVVTFAARVRADLGHSPQRRILLIGEDEDAIAAIIDLLGLLGRDRYDHARLSHLPLSFNRNGPAYDAVVLAAESSPADSLPICARLQAADLSAPVILVATGIDDDTLGQAIDVGVSEVLDALDLDAQGLDRAIQTAVARHRREERLQIEARLDDLTGLANRTSFRDRLDHALTLARRGNGKVALLMIDLDGFKAVNDRYGHPSGDELLKRVGERMRSRVRESDTVARLGGDEFGVLLPNIVRREDASVVIRKLLDTIRPPVQLDAYTASITASIGVAIFLDHAADAGQLIRLADAAMYRAKNDGGNGCAWHGEARVAARPEAEELAHACAADAVTISLRPQIALAPGRIVVGMRPTWHHPRSGMVDLLALRTLVEEAGLIDRLTEQLLSEAVQKLQAWQRHGFTQVEVAIPMLSRRPLAWADLAQQVGARMRQYDLSPARLQIEIDEAQFVDDLTRGGHGIAAFRETGVRLAVDRFGSGVTPLALLTSLRPAALRLCEEALDPHGSREKRAMFQSVTALASCLGIRTVAMGANDADRMAMARSIGVDAVESTLGYAHQGDACLSWLQVATRRACRSTASADMHSTINDDHLPGDRPGCQEIAQRRHDFLGASSLT
ncbi:MAG TPA: diguanylate cyclase [Geminicoccus sp.]|jgi:diguanylate cyclase (GGDEF)-like protein|uniref:putative bifunctional diguanylate cyclase/phosphodiesterase n=1 Tax=Geminicoccus sp. TaxID=2024832 RepID=UPI002E33E990|nr:diguanylate cyclase [Geminicoccus sp.]HEX2524960.1 diguanylate cyclase [Geminicoccus sp.]